MQTSNNHSVRLDLGPELRTGLIQYMAKHDLDREFAALQLLIKALRSEGFLTEEVYKFYLSRYDKPISNMKLCGRDEVKLCQIRNCRDEAVAVGVFQGSEYLLCPRHSNLYGNIRGWKIKKE